MADSVEAIRASSLHGVAHGFMSRRGGVSVGVLAGLNCGPGSGDDLDLVAENRARAVSTVAPGGRLVTVYQVHSPDCVTVTEPWPDDARPEADALVTDRPGLVLGIVTADCAPVLLADREAGIVGAAHAGWKGAIAGVTDNTLVAMEALGARRGRIVAAVGPCIAQASYEVDEAFRDRFLAQAAENRGFFGEGAPGHWQFDLEAYVVHRLRSAGIETVEALGLDTYADPDRFYSFRRSTHRGEPAYGRQISLIARV